MLVTNQDRRANAKQQKHRRVLAVDSYFRSTRSHVLLPKQFMQQNLLRSSLLGQTMEIILFAGKKSHISQIYKLNEIHHRITPNFGTIVSSYSVQQVFSLNFLIYQSC